MDKKPIFSHQVKANENHNKYHDILTSMAKMKRDENTKYW